MHRRGSRPRQEERGGGVAPRMGEEMRRCLEVGRHPVQLTVRTRARPLLPCLPYHRGDLGVVTESSSDLAGRAARQFGSHGGRWVTEVAEGPVGDGPFTQSEAGLGVVNLVTTERRREAARSVTSYSRERLRASCMGGGVPSEETLPVDDELDRGEYDTSY